MRINVYVDDLGVIYHTVDGSFSDFFTVLEPFLFFQKIESLIGKTIRKALAGSNFSLFLVSI